MGLFDFLKPKKPKVNVTFMTHEPTPDEMKRRWEEESFQNAKEKIRNFQKDEAGLYPHEILMIHYSEFYEIHQSDFPQFWRYEYAVNDPASLLKKLLKLGFIREATAKESLPLLNVSELKAILVELNQKVTGKKADLIKRISDSASEEYLLNRVKERRFAKTEAGEKELEKNAYVLYMHNHKIPDISMTDMCILVNKNPGRPFRDILWGEFNRLSGVYAEDKNWNYYRNLRYTMFNFLMEEEKTAPAFELLAEVFYYDLNGYGIPIIAPALVNALRTMEHKLDYSDEKIIAILSNRFKNLYAPCRRYTNDEVIFIITAYMISHDEMAEKVLNRKAEKNKWE